MAPFTMIPESPSMHVIDLVAVAASSVDTDPVSNRFAMAW